MNSFKSKASCVSDAEGETLTSAAAEAASMPLNTADAIYGRLRDLRAACGREPNKNDLVIVLISACIEEGINTGPGIVGTLKYLGFKTSHVGAILSSGTGNHPQRDRWQRHANGCYTLHG